VREDFEEACKSFGGQVERTIHDSICNVETRMGRVRIVLSDDGIAKIYARTQDASFDIDFGLHGEHVRDVFYSSGFFTIKTVRGNSCTFNRHGKMVYGTCLIDGKIISFSVDP